LISLSALCTAYEILQHGRAYREFLPGHNATIDSYQFDIKVKVPNFEPLPVALDGKYPDAIEIEFLQGRESPLRVGDPVPFQVVLINLLAPIFVQFFEDHKTWLDANIGSTDNWPAVLNFGRVIRNSLSHGGRINIKNSRAKEVQWYGVKYGPADHGRRIGLDLTIGDMLILMFEMSDELDRLGAPLP
jgi:hypothetical protein